MLRDAARAVLSSALLLSLGAVALLAVLPLVDSGPLGQWAHNLWVWLDQGANALLLGGDPSETVSQRMGRWLSGEYGEFRTWLARVGCSVLDLLDEDHCLRSLEPGPRRELF